jgi:hypothetical protein
MIHTDLLYKYYHGQFESIEYPTEAFHTFHRTLSYPYLVGRGAQRFKYQAVTLLIYAQNTQQEWSQLY